MVVPADPGPDGDPTVTDQELPDLLPCPFCGESEVSVVESGDSDCLVTCDCCLAEGPIATVGCRDDDDIDLELEAVTLWNQRKLGVVRAITRNTIKE